MVCRFGKSLGILRWHSCVSLGEERSFTDCSSSCPSCPWAVTRCGFSFASCFSGLPGSYLQSLQCPEHQTGHPGASGGISPGPAPRQGTTKVLHCFVTTPTPWDTDVCPRLTPTPSGWTTTQRCVRCRCVSWEHNLIALALSSHIYGSFLYIMVLCHWGAIWNMPCVHVARNDLWCVFSHLPRPFPLILPPSSHLSGSCKLCHIWE